MNLYDINKEIEDALNNIYSSMDEETGEVDEAYVHQLEELQMQRDEKLDNIGAYIKNLLAEAKMLKEEEQALKARRESKEKRAESLKNYVASNLKEQEINKFESARVVFSFRKSEQVNVPDLDKLDKKYLVEDVSYKADKKAIKEAIKSGVEVEGAYIEEKQNLQIK